MHPDLRLRSFFVSTSQVLLCLRWHLAPFFDDPGQLNREQLPRFCIESGHV
jgi:hypothetical protein